MLLQMPIEDTADEETIAKYVYDSPCVCVCVCECITQGASKLYVAYIQPLVKKHEIQIDNAIEQCEKSYQTQVVSVLRRNGFGFDSGAAGTSTSSSAAAMASQMESGDSRVHQ